MENNSNANKIILKIVIEKNSEGVGGKPPIINIPPLKELNASNINTNLLIIYPSELLLAKRAAYCFPTCVLKNGTFKSFW